MAGTAKRNLQNAPRSPTVESPIGLWEDAVKNASGVRGSLPSGSSARLERIAGCDSLFAAARDVNTRLPCVRDAGSARIRSGAALFQEPRGQHV